MSIEHIFYCTTESSHSGDTKQNNRSHTNKYMFSYPVVCLYGFTEKAFEQQHTTLYNNNIPSNIHAAGARRLWNHTVENRTKHT